LGGHIKRNSTGGTCGTYGVEERCIQGFGGKTQGKATWKIINVDGRIILNWILKKVDGRAGLNRCGTLGF
jgi:hypothetical protein